MRILTEYFETPLICQIWGIRGDPMTEDKHAEINQWCIDTVGYYARTAYNVYQFKTTADVMVFKLKWA